MRHAKHRFLSRRTGPPHPVSQSQTYSNWQDQAAPPCSRTRGSVILFVLGLILLTSLLLTQFISRAHTELLTEARRSQLEPLRGEAYSALQVSLAVLADIAAIDHGLHSGEQGWGQPLDYAEYTPPEGFAVTAEILDESGKLSLVTRDTTALQNLLRDLQVSAADADRFIEAFLAWTESEAISRSLSSLIDSEGNTPALAAPQAALRTFDELRFIPAIRAVLCDEQGDWNETGRAFLANVTLYPITTVNLNSASDAVLNALGLDARALASRRENPTGNAPAVFYTLDDTGAPPTAGTGVDASLLRIRITTSFGARHFTLEAIVSPGGGRGARGNNAQDEVETEPRPWTRNSIDSGFHILELQENNGF